MDCFTTVGKCKEMSKSPTFRLGGDRAKYNGALALLSKEVAGFMIEYHLLHQG